MQSQTSLDMEEHESVEALDAVGHVPNSQLPDTESESNTIRLDVLLHEL